MMQDVDATSPQELPALADLSAGNPQWQLQQLVTRNNAGAAEAPARSTDAKTLVANLAAETHAAPGKKVQSNAADPIAPLASQNEKNATTPAVLPAPTLESAVSNESPTPVSVAIAPAPAMVRATTVMPAPATVTVHYPPEKPEWKQAVSQHIATFSRNGIHNAEIRLHPEELGALQITLRVHQEQAQIHIISEHAQVRQAMEQAMPQLRAALAESGLQLGQANVSADNPYAGASDQQQNAEGQHTQQQDDEAAAEEEIVPTLLTSAPGSVYGINTFA